MKLYIQKIKAMTTIVIALSIQSASAQVDPGWQLTTGYPFTINDVSPNGTLAATTGETGPGSLAVFKNNQLFELNLPSDPNIVSAEMGATNDDGTAAAIFTYQPGDVARIGYWSSPTSEVTMLCDEDLPSGDAPAIVHGIDSNGRLWGRCYIDDGFESFYYTPESGIVIAQSIYPTAFFTVVDVASNGTMLGLASGATTPALLLLYNPYNGEGVKAYEAPGNFQPKQINNAGVVIGQVFGSGDGPISQIWANGKLFSLGRSSSADYAINNLNDVAMRDDDFESNPPGTATMMSITDGALAVVDFPDTSASIAGIDDNLNIYINGAGDSYAMSPSSTFTPATPYLRGDLNDTGHLNLADVMQIAQMVSGVIGYAPSLFNRLDVNGDGKTNIVDAIALSDYLFQQGQPPAPPYRVSGRSPLLN